MKPIVSIIVPVYNVERYLQRCIESILTQTFTEFELILINDGSKDKSGEICDRYAAEDNRIKVFHQKNAGVSQARNRGIEEACGKYIQFIDSDDYVDAEMTDMLIKKMMRTKCDLIICGFYMEEKQNRNVRLYVPFEEKSYDDIQSFAVDLPILMQNNLLNSPCNKLYNLYIIKKNRLQFNKNISLGEDLLFNLSYINCCNIFYLSQDCPYYYCYNFNSLTKKNDETLWENQKIIYGQVIYFLISHGVYFGETEVAIESMILNTVILTVQHYFTLPIPFSRRYQLVKQVTYDESAINAFEIGVLGNRYYSLLIKLLKMHLIFMAGIIIFSKNLVKKMLPSFFYKIKEKNDVQ